MQHICLAVVLIFLCSGCALTNKMGVKPWQRATLAKENMQLNHSSLQSSLDDHIYNAREATAGGEGGTGGGCGCN